MKGKGPRVKNVKKPKTAVRGKRLRCAKCRKRSPRPVLTPAPWYCERCKATLLETLG